MERMKSWILAISLAAVPLGASAQSAQELALVKGVFAQLQPLSIRKNREYCGYIGVTADGTLTATKAKKGSKSSCLANDPVELEQIYASYHTHGGFSRGYASETPSVDDIEGDQEEGIDGWVATPGGRLWYVDTEAMDIRIICGIGCLPMDAKFETGDMGHIEPHYTYNELVTFMADQ